jgi:hypothetical protein
MNKNSDEQYRRIFSPLPSGGDKSLASAVLGNLLGFLLLSPLIGNLFCRSFSLVCLYVALLEQEHKYKNIYDALFKILQGKPYRSEKKIYYWWFLLRLMVAFMQEQQIRQFLIYPDLEDNLINLGLNGPGKKEGYNVAYTFVGFSLWMFERGQIAKSLDMIKIAAEADKSWGYPEYLYGWFGLFAEGVDSVLHFSNAVHTDWNFLHRMRKDKTCQQHPEIIKEVSNRVIVSNHAAY